MKAEVLHKKYATLTCIVLLIVAFACGLLFSQGATTARAVVYNEEDGILYFVDCGAYALWSDTPSGSLNGGYADREYTDSSNWGYRVETDVDSSQEYYGSYYNVYQSVRSGDNNESKCVVYTFTLPAAGTYAFTVVLSDPWGNSDRTVNVALQGDYQDAPIEQIGADLVAGDGLAVANGTYTTTADGQTVTVTATRGTGNVEESPLVAAIVVAQTDSRKPLVADCKSENNLYGSVKESLIAVGSSISQITEDAYNEQVTVWLSNGEAKTYRGTDDGVTVKMETWIQKGFDLIVTFCIDELDGYEVYPLRYIWAQDVSDGELYYNIDCGFTGKGTDSGVVPTPPDDVYLLGSKQSTTHDRIFGADPDSRFTTSWGYVGETYDNGVFWEDNRDSNMSIREGLGGELVYKMTGFAPNETLLVDYGGHIGDDWEERVVGMYANGEYMSSLVLQSGVSNYLYALAPCTADENGELIVTFKAEQGGNPCISYILVYADTRTPRVFADRYVAGTCGDDTITLSNLQAGATVYVMTGGNLLLGSFTAPNATATVAIKDYLSPSVDTLRFMQATQALPVSQAATVRVTEHAYTNGLWQWNDDYAQATFTQSCALDPTHQRTTAAQNIVSETIRQATCAQTGSVKYTASVMVDGQTYTDEQTQEIAQTPHAHLKHIYGLFASCEWEGRLEHWYCTDCDKYFADSSGLREISSDVTVPIKPHELQHVDAVAPTCEHEGNAEYWMCTSCYKYFIDADGKTQIAYHALQFDKLAHDMTHHAAVAPTDDEEGNVEYWSCDLCGKNYTDASGSRVIDDVTIPPLKETIEPTPPEQPDTGNEGEDTDNDTEDVTPQAERRRKCGAAMDAGSIVLAISILGAAAGILALRRKYQDL